MDSNDDRCVFCSKKVSSRQHALLCDCCNHWQHRLCDTGELKRGPEYRYIRSLMALPFLPSADIQPAFDRLAVRATSEELQQLVAYMNTNWIDSAVWQPRNWSIFQTNIRTNNDVEGNLNHIYLKKID